MLEAILNVTLPGGSDDFGEFISRAKLRVWVEIQDGQMEMSVEVSSAEVERGERYYGEVQIEENSQQELSVEFLENALVYAKAQTKEGLAGLLENGWQLFRQTIYRNQAGRRIHKWRASIYLFAANIDMTPWKSRTYFLHDRSASSRYRSDFSRSQLEFWEWQQTLPSSKCVLIGYK